jgi:hypothetical protein
MKMLHQVLVACLIGGIMGVLGHVKKRGRLEKPRMTKRFIYLGFFEDILVGMTLLLFCLFYPRNPIREFSLSCYPSLQATAVKLYLRSFDFVREQQANVQNSERQTKSPHE